MSYREYHDTRPAAAAFDIGQAVRVDYPASPFDGSTGTITSILVDDDQLRYVVTFGFDGEYDEFTESMLASTGGTNA